MIEMYFPMVSSKSYKLLLVTLRSLIFSLKIMGRV